MAAAATTQSTTRLSSRTIKTALAVLGAVVVLVAMYLSTTFLSPAEEAKVNPPPFNGETYSAEAFPKQAAAIEAKAVDLGTLIPAVEKDLQSAIDQYGTDSGSGNATFAVTTTAAVTDVDENFIYLESPVRGDKVLIPLGLAVNGTPVRDALGTIKFGDFIDQTDFQTVANQFKLIIQKDVLAPVDTANLKGKTVTVVGAWSTGGAENTYIIQPVKLEVQ